MNTTRAPQQTAARKTPPRQVRIIGGQWRQSRLPVADSPGLRPTPERLRETLFNWLGQDLTGWRVLDAFAGSGALGFEAASRGAAAVVLLECSAALVRGLAASRQRLGAEMITVQRADALAWMRAAPRASFDLVLLDPPFAASLSAPAFAAAAPLVAPGGFIYLEANAASHEVAPPDTSGAGWTLQRHSRAGAVHGTLWRRTQCQPTQCQPN